MYGDECVRACVCGHEGDELMHVCMVMSVCMCVWWLRPSTPNRFSSDLRARAHSDAHVRLRLRAGIRHIRGGGAVDGVVVPRTGWWY